MSHRERIIKAIDNAVDKLNQRLPEGVHIEKSPNEIVYGKSGKLESLDFVIFIMELETNIKDEFGIDILLTDQNLLSKEKSPFTTIGVLTEHLVGLLPES